IRSRPKVALEIRVIKGLGRLTAERSPQETVAGGTRRLCVVKTSQSSMLFAKRKTLLAAGTCRCEIPLWLVRPYNEETVGRNVNCSAFALANFPATTGSTSTCNTSLAAPTPTTKRAAIG